MELLFDFDQRQGITNIHFDGLTGAEGVSSVKQALGLLKIRNPAVAFSANAKAGIYNDIPDAEYKRMLETVKFISSMWCYMDEPRETPPKYEMNALMLLANAIEALSQFNVLYQMPFQRYKREHGAGIHLHRQGSDRRRDLPGQRLDPPERLLAGRHPRGAF